MKLLKKLRNNKNCRKYSQHYKMDNEGHYGKLTKLVLFF